MKRAGLVLLIVVLCSCLVGSLSRPSGNKVVGKKRGIGKDVEEFLLGFVVGVETTIGNVTECTKDANATLDYFEIGFIDLKNGIDGLNRDLIEQGLIEWATGVLTIAGLLEDCGIVTLAEEIMAIARKIQEGPAGIVEIVVDEVVNIFYHGTSLIKYFDQSVSSFESGDFYTSGVNVGEIVAILLQD